MESVITQRIDPDQDPYFQWTSPVMAKTRAPGGRRAPSDPPKRDARRLRPADRPVGAGPGGQEDRFRRPHP